MRKKCTILFMLLILLTANLTAHAAGFSENAEKEINAAYEVATQYLAEYYYAVETKRPYDFKSIIRDELFQSFVEKKIETKQCKYIIYDDDDVRDYSMSFQLNDFTIGNDDITLFIVVSASYHYKNADVDSAYNELNQVVLHYYDGKFYVKDCYTPYDFYDLEVRGEIYEELAKELDAVTSLKEKQNKYLEKIRNYYVEMKNDLEIRKEQTESNDVGNIQPKMMAATWHSVNRSAIVTWAVNNYSAVAPNSGNSNQVSNYIDFAAIPGAYDCTNFVSHAILAGGAVVYDTGNSGLSSTGWYCRNINNRSHSWSGVGELHSFLTTNSTMGPMGIEIAYAPFHVTAGVLPYNCGDIMQFQDGTTWRHSAVITSLNTINDPNIIEPLLTDRTSKCTNHTNRRQSDIYPGNSRRIIVLAGYYS